MIKYHWSEDVTNKVADIIEPFKRQAEWEALQIPGREKPSGAVLLCGRPGCLDGLTTMLEVKRANHTTKMGLQEFFFRFNYPEEYKTSSGKQDKSINWKLQSHLNGLTFSNRVISVLSSGIKKCLKLHFSNGSSLVLTPDHPVMMLDESFEQAQHLRIGDKVIAKGDMKSRAKAGKQPRKQRRYVETLKYYHGGNTHIVAGCIYQRTFFARLIYEAIKLNNVPVNFFITQARLNPNFANRFKILPRGYEIHHIDGNPMNDEISNLLALTHVEHSRLHAQLGNLNVNYSELVTLTKIEDAGERRTFDIQMASPANNFEANGVFVHNTGKSTLAMEMLKKVSGMNKGAITTLAMGNVGSEKLGQTEKSIMAAFKEAIAKCKSASAVRSKSRVPVLIMDEVDAIGWERDKVTDSQMFMLSIINILLIEIDLFMEKGGLIAFTTNFPDKLDAALRSRITDEIHLSPPIGEESRKVWESLMPPKPFGIEVTDDLCNLQLVPRDIEHWIFTESRRAFRAHENMSLRKCNFCRMGGEQCEGCEFEVKGHHEN